MRWNRRTQVMILVVSLAVWGGAAYWRVTQPGPAAPAAAGKAAATPRRTEAKAEGGRKAAGTPAGPPTLRLDLLDRPVPALRAEATNLFASPLPPPPPLPPLPRPAAAAPPAAAPRPAAAPPPPPPDPFLEEARRLRVVAVLQEGGQEVVFIAEGHEVHSAKKNDVIDSRFLIKDLTEDAVVVSKPNGETEVRLSLTGPPGPGGPARQP